MSYLRLTIDIVTGLFGTFLIAAGVYGIVSPSSMARIFGIVNVTPEMVVFYPGLGGRKLAAGLAIWGMKLTGQRKALGMFLSCWVCAGVADTYLLLNHWGPVDSVGIHVFNTCVLAVVGPALIFS